jgi:hypothetical protein
MDFDAEFFSKVFVEEARKASNGVSYAGGVQKGIGTIPYDTGALAKSITLTYAFNNSAVILVGNKEEVPYAEWLQNNEYVGKTKVVNRHYQFIEKFAANEFANSLRKYGEVTVKEN